MDHTFIVTIWWTSGRSECYAKAIQIPSALVVGLNGLVVVFVVCSTTIRERIQRKFTLQSEAETMHHEANSGPGYGEFFTISVLIATFASGVRLATPYLLAH